MSDERYSYDAIMARVQGDPELSAIANEMSKFAELGITNTSQYEEMSRIYDMGRKHLLRKEYDALIGEIQMYNELDWRDKPEYAIISQTIEKLDYEINPKPPVHEQVAFIKGVIDKIHNDPEVSSLISEIHDFEELGLIHHSLFEELNRKYDERKIQLLEKELEPLVGEMQFYNEYDRTDDPACKALETKIEALRGEIRKIRPDPPVDAQAEFIKDIMAKIYKDSELHGLMTQIHSFDELGITNNDQFNELTRKHDELKIQLLEKELKPLEREMQYYNEFRHDDPESVVLNAKIVALRDEIKKIKPDPPVDEQKVIFDAILKKVSMDPSLQAAGRDLNTFDELGMRDGPMYEEVSRKFNERKEFLLRQEAEARLDEINKLEELNLPDPERYNELVKEYDAIVVHLPKQDAALEAVKPPVLDAEAEKDLAFFKQLEEMGMTHLEEFKTSQFAEKTDLSFGTNKNAIRGVDPVRFSNYQDAVDSAFSTLKAGGKIGPGVFEDYHIEEMTSKQKENLEKVLKSPMDLGGIPESERDAFLCANAVARNGMALQFVPGASRSNAIENIALNSDPMALQYVRFENRTSNNVLRCVQQNPEAIRYAPEQNISVGTALGAIMRDEKLLEVLPSSMKNDEGKLLVPENMYDTLGKLQELCAIDDADASVVLRAA